MNEGEHVMLITRIIDNSERERESYKLNCFASQWINDSVSTYMIIIKNNPVSFYN